MPPAYTGIYSDDEFSSRAFEDGVMVDARDLVFVHEHPNYDSAIEMDERYRRQNDDWRYAEARAIFKERNPAAKKRWFVKDHWERRWFRRRLARPRTRRNRPVLEMLVTLPCGGAAEAGAGTGGGDRAEF